MSNSVQNYIYNIYTRFQISSYKHSKCFRGLILVSCVMPPLSNFYQFFESLWGQADFLWPSDPQTKQWVHFDFVTVQFGHVWKILRRRVCFEPEAWPWLTACFISKISERNAASWFECSNWIFLSSVRRGLSWFSSIWILFTFKSFLCCASFSLRLLLLTTASEINWRWSSEMFTS